MEFCDFADGLLLDGVAADRDLDGNLKDALVDGSEQDMMGIAQAFIWVFRGVAGLSLKIGVPKQLSGRMDGCVDSLVCISGATFKY